MIPEGHVQREESRYPPEFAAGWCRRSEVLQDSNGDCHHHVKEQTQPYGEFLVGFWDWAVCIHPHHQPTSHDADNDCKYACHRVPFHRVFLNQVGEEECKGDRTPRTVVE